MELAIFIYLANFVGKLHTALWFGVVLFMASAFAHAMWCEDQRMVYGKTDVKYSWKYIWLAFACVVGIVGIPSERTMYLMAGGYATQKVGEVVVQSEISKDILKILELKVKKELSSMTSEVTGEKK